MIPVIDNRGHSDILKEMNLSLADKGIRLTEGDEFLSVLTELYARMLAGSTGRLSRLPEKHRLVFLNLIHTPPGPAWPAAGIAVFDVVKGYVAPVQIPEGTRVIAESPDGDTLSYRIRKTLTAIPSGITDVFWTDPTTGRYGYSDSCMDIKPWSPDTTKEIGYKAYFIFPNVFLRDTAVILRIKTGAEQTKAGPMSDLDSKREKIRWSLCAWPTDTPVYTPATVSTDVDGSLCIHASEKIPGSEFVCLRMELCAPISDSLKLEGISLKPPPDTVRADFVLSGGRRLDPSRFYPFGSPMRSYEECGIFNETLARHGTEITVRFRISLEELEELLPEVPEETNFKWIMRKPKEKPKTEVVLAYAKAVRFEYWNGFAYCEIKSKSAIFGFDEENDMAEFCFDCPEDIASGSYQGLDGYYMRLSCGECGELYKLPRKIYTPLIEDLSFSYHYTREFYPCEIKTECLGVSRIYADGDFPVPLFKQPSQERLLYLGFDRLDFECTMKLYIELVNRFPTGAEGSILKARLRKEDEEEELGLSDETEGFSGSGSLSIDIPGGAKPGFLFGRERYWISLYAESMYLSVSGGITGIYLNAQEFENRVRYEERFAYSHLSDASICLSHANIIRALVSVLEPGTGTMELWKEYEPSDGKFRGKYYKIDYISGLITFPEDIAGLSISAGPLDLIHVEYDATGGGAGNLPSNSLRKLEQEIPFIQSVYNPMAISGGVDSESGAALARRKQNTLYNGGRLVTKRDYELFAVDFCPDTVHSALCFFDSANNTVTLAILLYQYHSAGEFLTASWRLRNALSGLVDYAVRDGKLHIVPVEPVAYRCVMDLRERRKWEDAMPSLQNKLSNFLNPVSGGADGNGWPIGMLPTGEQIRAYLLYLEPNLPLSKVRLQLGSAKNKKVQVPGNIQISVNWR